MNDTNRLRIYGFDLIRITAFIAIIAFHSSWVVYLDVNGAPDPLPTFSTHLAELYSRALSFSGFVVILLSSFLIGMRSGKYAKSFWLPFFLFFGWGVFCFLTYVKEKEFSFEWDIYPLLAIGLFTGGFLLKQSKAVRIFFTALSVLMLCIPFWKIGWFYTLPFYVGQIFVGQCPQDYADWPIFPWVGLMWLGMLGGSLTQDAVDKNFDFRFRKWEAFAAFGILFYLYQFRGAYYHTPLGNGWACHNFRQEPQAFWAHLLFWIALIRISLNPTVNTFLSKRRFVHFISNLAMNRHFFLAYLLHYIVLFAISGFLEAEQNPTLFVIDVITILEVPVTELCTRFIITTRRRAAALKEYIPQRT